MLGAPAGLTPPAAGCVVATAVGDDRRMTAWHPLTKLVIASGSLAIAWLVVSGPPEAPATVAAARVRSVAPAAAPSPDPAIAAVASVAQRLDLPPRESFRASLERPLFSASRRPPARLEPVVAEAPQPVAAVASDEPPFRLVGTVGRRGLSEALVTLGGGLERVAVGARLEGWLVTAVGPDHVEVERDGLRRRLQILR